MAVALQASGETIGTVIDLYDGTGVLACGVDCFAVAPPALDCLLTLMHVPLAVKPPGLRVRQCIADTCNWQSTFRYTVCNGRVSCPRTFK